MRAGVATAVIWTLGTIGAVWLKHLGAGWVVPVVFGTWVVVALPVLYLDLSLILDMAGYMFTGRVHVFPALLAFDHATSAAERNYWADAIRPPGMPARDLTQREEDSLRATIERSRVLRGILAFIDASSPFSCFALWSMIVLARIPTKAYVLTRPSQARRMKLAADRTVYEDTLCRLAP